MTSSPESQPKPPRFITIDEYQAWSDQNWLYPKSSSEAQQHFSRKLQEELIEVLEAILESDALHSAEEIGDAFWVALACASNCGISASDGLVYAYSGEFGEDYDISLARIDEFAATQDLASREELINLFAELEKYARYWLKLGPLIDEQLPPSRFSDVYILLSKYKAMDALGSIIIQSGRMASEFGFSLTEIVGLTANKLDARLAAGKPVTKIPK